MLSIILSYKIAFIFPHNTSCLHCTPTICLSWWIYTVDSITKYDWFSNDLDMQIFIIHSNPPPIILIHTYMAIDHWICFLYSSLSKLSMLPPWLLMMLIMILSINTNWMHTTHHLAKWISNGPTIQRYQNTSMLSPNDLEH